MFCNCNKSVYCMFCTVGSELMSSFYLSTVCLYICTGGRRVLSWKKSIYILTAIHCICSIMKLPKRKQNYVSDAKRYKCRKNVNFPLHNDYCKQQSSVSFLNLTMHFLKRIGRVCTTV